MSEQLTFNQNEKRIEMVNPEASFPPKLTIELYDDTFKQGYEAGLRAQFQMDCEAECSACGKPEKYHPAVWDEESNFYRHETIKGGKMETCDATLLFFGWEMRNNGTTNS